MEIYEALTFDDVTLVPAYSEILPQEVDLKSIFSRNVPLNIPIVSSPMDTVTESQMAIALAKEGGLGIIHRRLPIDQQAREVKKVKRHQSSIIASPYTLHPNDFLHVAIALMREKGISGIPVTDNSGNLLGIITKRDLSLYVNSDAVVGDVMTKRGKLVTASPGVSPKEALELMIRNRIEKLPLIDEEFKLKGLITAKDLEGRNQFPNANTDAFGQLYVGAAVGATGDFLERALELKLAGVNVIVIDSSHGDSQNVVKALIKLKQSSTMFDVVVGNIVTAEAAQMLVANGADGLRVGIGSGSICTTRIVTGCGVPQITANIWVREGTRDSVPFCSDGGARYSGDIVKALASGASSVMFGSVFAGTEESPGEKFQYQGHAYKKYRGMGSEAVIKSGVERYGAKAVPEGIEGAVPQKGTLADTVAQLSGGLRQGMGYLGCHQVKDLRSAQFVKSTNAGASESHVHDVIIMNEAPNYPINRRNE